MTRREAYVSCSRATSANGLEIIGQFIVPKEIPDNDKVKIELNRLRQIGFQFELKIVNDIKTIDDFQIIYFNIQSLNYKLELISNDFFFSNADLICLSEARLYIDSNYELNEFSIASIINNSSKNRNLGSIIYINNKHKKKVTKINTTLKFAGSHYCLIESFLIEISTPINLIVIYKSPKYSNSSLFENISQIINEISAVNSFNKLLVGDFNINVKNYEDWNLATIKLTNQFMKNNQLHFSLPMNQSSTDLETQIDLCFSTISPIQCNYYESFPVFSYHKPIWLLLNQFQVSCLKKIVEIFHLKVIYLFNTLMIKTIFYASFLF